MLIQTRIFKLAKGHAEDMAAKFSQESPVDGFAGLIDRTVMVNSRNKEYDEVMVMIRWESSEAWKNWEKSDVHLAGHRAKRGNNDPDYVLDKKVAMYETYAVIQGPAREDPIFLFKNR
ncbi:antibiotic biosynthesis monooxygenase [Paenibacillus physcomitrellae]|uniref:Heme-degrading monooxygenase HmoA n=1 Tax=Paenibacillus physcomitrellae TaxID=1619311 RepID=A0ABQ1FVE4_9BACL|nr:antibiotic biosynthesis monooxygenase [Paenibacillus physcomitrellae]GGA30070.1 heme-degrading monooxygenase HmoA [Paenibacillus physcomitrellae]